MPDPFSPPPLTPAPDNAAALTRATTKIDNFLYELAGDAYDMLVRCEDALAKGADPSGRPFGSEDPPFIWAPWLAGSNALLFGFGIGLGKSIELGSSGLRFDPETGEIS